MAEPRRKTDYGTVVLHAALVLTFLMLVATGLRIAADDPISPWLQALDPVLPVEHLWYRHLVSGVLLTAVLVGYAVYVAKARLTARVQLDKTRLVAMLRPGRGRFAAINVLVYWLLMAGLVTEIVSGVMLFAEAGRTVLTVHLYATFLCVGAIVMHVVLHAAYGGLGQVLRIVRPAPLHIPPALPDLAELLAEQLAKTRSIPLDPSIGAAGVPATTADAEPASASALDQTSTSTGRATAPDGTTRPVRPITLRTSHAAIVEDHPPEETHRIARLQSNPFVSGLVAAAAVGAVAVGSEQMTRPTLFVAEVKRHEAPVLDGDLSDPAWAKARTVSVLTTQGGDFGGTGQSLVEIRALHDGEFAYFAFVWEDPTRSLKHQPLVKHAGRWQIAASREDLLDESKYHEDKFAVLLTRPTLPLIGAAIHLSRKPLQSHPASSTGRGLHYTDGGIADLWLWRASHTGQAGHVDNCHFGGPAPPQPDGGHPAAHYSGGFAPDPGPADHEPNFVETVLAGGGKGIVPKRLPRDVQAMARAMGRVADSQGQSESEGSRWWMTHGETLPYAPALDAALPDGTVIPGILMTDEIADRRDSLRGAARWAAGRWTLEIVRRLHTGSDFDVPLRTGGMMWVAAFDHAEMRHTRHLRPFRLELE